MRTKTLHSEWEWKQITGEISIEENVRIDLGNGSYRIQSPEQAQFVRDQQKKFAPYVDASKRNSRHGILLDIIKSSAPFGVVRSAISYYRGFRSGFRTIVRMIEKENKRLFDVSSTEQPPPGSYWSIDSDSHISELVEILGWMQTEKSHAYLMQLATGDFHPIVQAESINAMAFEGVKFDSEFMLALVKDPSTPEPMLYHALFCMMYNSRRFKGEDYYPAVWPFVKHRSWNIRYEAILACGVRYGGRKRLRKYLERVATDSDFEPRTLEAIKFALQGHEEYDAEKTLRIARRKVKELENQSGTEPFESED